MLLEEVDLQVPSLAGLVTSRNFLGIGDHLRPAFGGVAEACQTLLNIGLNVQQSRDAARAEQ